jgi:hypothetical protein
LKDWDINIYRGILTGYNEAFIVSEGTRNEILANCRNDDERKRTDELIRPILRGRDIKRYSYEWAHLYIIATFPSRHYDIEQYPAVKKHLLSFGMERLEQTGKTHIVNGEKIVSRKKTHNKWFETQDQIGYWDDFSKPKIAWADIATEPSFVLTDKVVYMNNTCYMITGAPDGLIGFLNSKLMQFYFPSIAPGLGENGCRYFKQFVEMIKAPQTPQLYQQIEAFLAGKNYNEIDKILCSFYDLTRTEMDYLISM